MFPPVFEPGVQWDGVLYVPLVKHLYLIQAKHNLETAHIAGMPAHIQRTLHFMRMCKEGQLPLAASTFH